MPFPSKLAIASSNPGKVGEILSICRDWPVTWVTATGAAGETPSAAAWPAVEETGRTYLENARLKAGAVAAHAGVPAVADDSGIEVDALGGLPGPRSARFAGPGADDRANLQLLIERVREAAPEARTARYRSVVVCAWPDGREVHAEGTCEGRLITEPRGSGGFGYDPIFVPRSETRTMAELSPEEKDRISHRGRAFRALRRALEAPS